MIRNSTCLQFFVPDPELRYDRIIRKPDKRPPFGCLAFSLYMTDEAVEQDDGCSLDGKIIWSAVFL
jgi:hypothetical protein